MNSFNEALVLGFSISPDTVHVRELIEKLVETIIGGSLDGITVGKLSAHASCECILNAGDTQNIHLYKSG